MKNKLTNNIPLKIVSVLVGILIWLLVVNIDNPIITTSFVIPDGNVEIINEAYIDSTGKMAMQEENQPPIRVYVTGPRKAINHISASDIHATVDMQQVVSLDTNPVMAPITATVPGVLPGNIRVTPTYLGIHLEEKLTQEFPINVTDGDTRPGKGYEIGSQTANPEKVKITGPKSLINKIDKVNALVNVDGITSDKTEDATLTIIDKNQDTLPESQMAYLKMDTKGKVTVTTKLWAVRSDVYLNADYVGTPKYGYKVESVSTVPDMISVAGTEEALKNLALQGNVIWLPSDKINVQGKDKDVEIKLNLKDILPEGLKLTTGSSEDVWVKVNILPDGGHEFSIPTKNIQILNKNEDYQLTFETDKVDIRVQASNGKADSLKENQIKLSINVQNKGEGVYDLPVNVQLPSGYGLIEGVNTEVKISKVTKKGE